ncbi:ferredoxin reductase [Rhizobium sp. Root708]|uniref:NAD(P)/FAD-dependent oxidoreductase n=1 Tax=Rhizobium sp. Root708 TaxID=1736592 RepID=UPI0006FBD1BE|nr:FAD-dependent oxidoreductase [Rhizobium sp. Root708]KRB60655.1 ferredoxin reductase [Rhizobium sp. Root708]
MSHFVIIGAGECGARAAFALREKGFQGKVTLVGTEPFAPYERPPLSKSSLSEMQEPKFVAPKEKYEQSGIELLTGVDALAIDLERKSVSLSSGQEIAYDKLLIATGASARRLPGLPVQSRHIMSLRTHHDAVAIRRYLEPGKQVLIIGGGFIGLEVAATARSLGAQATLVEGLERVLKRGVPQEIAEVISARHTLEGVALRCGVAIARVEESDTGVTVELATGETLYADLVLVGIGASPNTELAERSGLAIENGIAVDQYLQTSAADVYAAGDCCSFPLGLYGGRRIRLESWRNAQEQGTLAAASMMGIGRPISSVPWFWSDQYDLTLQIAGLAEGAVTHLRREIGEGSFIVFHLDADGRLLAASGVGPGNSVARDIRLAEMLIAARACPDPAALVAPDVKLKSLLAA